MQAFNAMMAIMIISFMPTPKEKPQKLKDAELLYIIQHSQEVPDPSTLDMKMGEGIISGEMPVEEPDLSSKYESIGIGRERGDLKVEPEFKYDDFGDPTLRDREMEKEFKLKFNLGL